MDTLHSLEIIVNLWLQSLGSWIAAPASALSFLGTETFYLLAMPALFWCIDAGLGLRIGLMLTLSGASNTLLKLAFHTSRPYWVDTRVQAFNVESSFGLPSGHAQNAAALWGVPAVTLRRRWITWACAAVVLLIGLSRLALGVHFLSDVLLGWLLGAALLYLLVRAERPVLAWVRRQPFGRLLAYCLLSALAIIALVCLPSLALRGWSFPAAWASGITAAGQELPDPLNLDSAFTMGGIWLGLTTGSAWTFLRRGGFSPRPGLLPRAASYLLGLVVLGGLWYGLGAVFPRQADLPSYTLRFLRYALVSGWVSAGAPWLFRRLGLVK